jgi:catechol 2,3-dioxygenase
MGLPAGLTLGPVHLTVTDLERSIGWYQQVLGMRVHWHEAPMAALGAADEEVLVLVEDPEARPPGRTAGLYHYALLYPSRDELARAVLRLGAVHARVSGMSDHETHEAIYLADPDGNGIELAADRPRDQWPASLGYASGPQPLDLQALLDTVGPVTPPDHVEPGLRVGHLHLHVGDIERALGHYRDVVGFDVMALLPTAAFVSAGGYHHHLGFNVWRGQDVAPAAEGAVGLRHWTVRLPDPADLEALEERVRDAGIEAPEGGEGALAVADPWRNVARFTA